MFSRQSPRRMRVYASAVVLSSPWALVLPLSAQTTNYPSVPAPQQVPAESLPSLPVASPAQTPQSVGAPADAPQGPPAPTRTQDAPPANARPAPQGGNGTQPGGQVPSVQPYKDPLETPIRVQQAQPGQPQPVNIAAPIPVSIGSFPSVPTDYPVSEKQPADHLGSVYINDDDTIYPMALRLYSLGYLNTAFISMRPWTRRSLLHALENSSEAIQSGGDEQALGIYNTLMSYLASEVPGTSTTAGMTAATSATGFTGTPSSEMTRGIVYGLDAVYDRGMGITGLTLRDSYHLGQTISNDYGRPEYGGFNDLTGFSTINEWGRFSLSVRGEYQHAPTVPGYSAELASYLSYADFVPFLGANLTEPTVPYGTQAALNPFRLQEATLSFHLASHEISAGKSDAWLGPAQGASMAWSNNAENIYSFRINRVENFNIPYFTKVFGGLRYDFFVGSLKGHTFYHDPWIHSEMFSLRPTDNFEFTFQRSVIWGGQGHVPVTFGTFFRSFFSTQDTETDPASKSTSADPGARFSDFSFSWRLPFLRKYVTLYTDSICHDDVSPISAPRRAAYRPGVYLAQIPGLRKLDFRVEAASTDTSTLRSEGGEFNYYEIEQRQGYTNKGFIMGDWIGREAKGGDAWLTYHLSPNEWVQVSYLNKKTPKDFIAGGTTQNQFKAEVVKRLRPDVELDAWYQHETWKAPLYVGGAQNDNVITAGIKFYPKLRTRPALVGLNGKAMQANGSGETR